MNISKKQLKFIELVEKCGYLLKDEIDKQQYPDSMVSALIEKKLIFEHEGMLAITTG